MLYVRIGIDGIESVKVRWRIVLRLTKDETERSTRFGKCDRTGGANTLVEIEIETPRSRDARGNKIGTIWQMRLRERVKGTGVRLTPRGARDEDIFTCEVKERRGTYGGSGIHRFQRG